MSAVTVRAHDGGVRFSVRVQPRASRTELSGSMHGSLKVRLQAPPVDGAANAALVDFLAERLGVARRAIRIVTGASSRTKVVHVDGVDADAVQALCAEG